MICRNALAMEAGRAVQRTRQNGISTTLSNCRIVYESHQWLDGVVVLVVLVIACKCKHFIQYLSMLFHFVKFHFVDWTNLQNIPAIKYGSNEVLFPSWAVIIFCQWRPTTLIGKIMQQRVAVVCVLYFPRSTAKPRSYYIFAVKWAACVIEHTIRFLHHIRPLPQLLPPIYCPGTGGLV